MYDVSIIIVNYNTLQLTKECIDSIVDMTTGVSYEIILVDNASNDGSKVYFEKDERIRYIYSYENMGFGRANNVGMMLAKGRYFFLLNSDTYLLNNAVFEFYKFACKYNTKAFYGCFLYNKNGEVIHSANEMVTLLSIIKGVAAYYQVHKTNNNLLVTNNNLVEVGYVTGADLFFHRSLYEMSGGFDHNFFMYYEESDWQRRMRNMNVRSYLLSNPKIVHLDGGSQIDNVSHFNEGRTKRFFRSQRYFIKKHYSSWKYLLYRVVVGLLYIPVIIFSPKYSLKEKIRRLLVTLF